jgi:hypothetical protein
MKLPCIYLLVVVLGVTVPLAVILQLKTKITFHIISMLCSTFRKNAGVSLEIFQGCLHWDG